MTPSPAQETSFTIEVQNQKPIAVEVEVFVNNTSKIKEIVLDQSSESFTLLGGCLYWGRSDIYTIFDQRFDPSNVQGGLLFLENHRYRPHNNCLVLAVYKEALYA